MSIQIFGTAKCRATQKALRFFRERGADVHFVDLNKKKISAGELESISRSVPMEDLIDKEGRLYEKLGLKYIRHNIKEKLLEEPLLLKTPVVRCKGKASAGEDPSAWQKFFETDKNL